MSFSRFTPRQQDAVNAALRTRAVREALRRGGAGNGRRSGFRGYGSTPLPSLYLGAGGTFTRTTEASYLTGAPTDGSSAFLAWAAINARRIENRGDGLGDMLLMEGARTNLLLRSREHGHASWTAQATITADQNGGPDNAALADRINASSGQYGCYQNDTAWDFVICGSVWIRAVSGTIAHQAAAFGVGSGSASLTSIGTTYRRPSTAAYVATDGGYLPLDGRDLTAVSPGAGQVATAQDAYVDLSQLESGWFPSSAIRTTTAAVTRGADDLSYAVGQYPASFLTSGFEVTFAPDCTSAEMLASFPIGGSYDQHIVSFAGSNHYLSIYTPDAIVIKAILIGPSGSVAPTITFSRGQRVRFRCEPSAGRLTISGATTGDGTYTGTVGAMTSGALHVGKKWSGVGYAFGRFGTSIVGL